MKEQWKRIWERMKLRNKDKVKIFIKDNEKELVANEEGFAIKCEVKDLFSIKLNGGKQKWEQ